MDERHKELRPTSCNGPSIDYADVQMKSPASVCLSQYVVFLSVGTCACILCAAEASSFVPSTNLYNNFGSDLQNIGFTKSLTAHCFLVGYGLRAFASIQSYDLERHCIFEVHFLYGIFVFGDLMQGKTAFQNSGLKLFANFHLVPDCETGHLVPKNFYLLLFNGPNVLGFIMRLSDKGSQQSSC
ncbi:hypothetical protein Peur_006316 [Populus x canadensis]